MAFFDGERPLAYQHFYAMHPQSYYGDGRVTYDVPGLARQRLEEESGVAQIYFSGCGGNITMGKYNDGTPEARGALADRLYDAMARSLRSIRRQAARPSCGRRAKSGLLLRSGKEFEEGRAACWPMPAALGVADESGDAALLDRAGKGRPARRDRLPADGAAADSQSAGRTVRGVPALGTAAGARTNSLRRPPSACATCARTRPTRTRAATNRRSRSSIRASRY